MPDDLAQRAIQLFSSIPYFQGVEPRLLAEIARAAIPRRIDAGQLLILEGEPAAGLYIVEQGELKVTRMAMDGREQTLHFLGSGEVFNAISVFTGTPNPASVTALAPSTVWLIRRDVVLELLERHPPLARIVIQSLAGRILNLLTLVEDLSLRSVEARLARLLLESAVDGRVQRKRWATQNEMASRLGTVPDVVSRTLRQLAERGMIRISRSEIQILDRTGLESAARIETQRFS